MSNWRKLAVDNGTASYLEILTVAANIMGIIAAWRMAALTLGRYRAVILDGGSKAGPRILAADRHFRCEIARIIFHIVTMILVIWAFTLPSSGSAYSQSLMWTRLGLSTLFTWCSIMDLTSDSKLASMLRDPYLKNGEP
jgi:pimeloyl-ACP methyl ester carboxylesterase